MRVGRRERGRGREREKGKENLRKWNSQDGRRTETERRREIS